MKSIYAVIVLICAVAFTVDPSVYAPYQSPKMLLCVAIPLLSITIIYLHRLIRKKTVSVSISVLEVLLLVQLFWSFISSPETLSSTSTLESFPLIAFLLIVCMVRQIQVKENALSEDESLIGNNSSVLLMMRTIWIVGICQALIGLAQYCTVFDWLPIGTGKTRMIGTIGAANGYGTFLAVSVIAVVIEWIETQSVKLKIGLVLAGMLLLSALLLNGSRGALLGLAGAIVVFIAMNRKKLDLFSGGRQNEMHANPKIRFVLLIVSLAVLLSGLAYYLYHLNVESSQGRILVWSVSAPMIKDHPIAGVGTGRYSVEYLNYQARFFQDPGNQRLAYKAANIKLAMSDYIHVLCESGIVGGLLFAGLLASALWFFIIHRPQSVLIAGACSALVVILLHSVVDTPLHVTPVSVVAASLIGFTPVPPKRVWQFQISSRSMQMMFFCILIAAVVVVATISYQYYQGHIYWHRGYELNMQHRWQFALPEYEKALEKLPQEGELLFHLGAAEVIMNSYSKGIYHLQQARQWYNDRNIYLSVSQGYIGLHQFAEAEQYAKLALQMFPDHLAPHLLLGQIYFKTGRIPESKESLLKCIRRSTTIRSDEVEQIGSDAQELWNQYYNGETGNPAAQ